MNSIKKNLLKKEKRREKISQTRQALLINEYIYTKYFNIYQEAARYYNELNNMYPSRPDLRKCDEFRAWKMAANGAPIRIRKYPKVCYTNIPVEIQPVEMPVQPVEMPVQPDEMPVQPVEMPVQSDEMPVQSDEMPVQPVEMPVQSDEIPVQLVEMPVQSVQPDERIPKKVMELKIQLLDSAVITETLSIQTEEIIQENTLEVAAEGIIQKETPTLHPSLTEEIPQEIIDKIVNELREDPELRTIMTDIEQSLEFEQVGNELDIFEDDRLEEELENMMLW